MMVVVVAIGILIAIAIPTAGNYYARSRDTIRETDLKDISKALTSHYSDREYYPVSTLSGCIDNTVLSTTYMNSVPSSPSGNMYDE